MSNELEKLQKAFQRETPIKADETAKIDAIDAAMAAFAQEKAKTRQGNSIGNRLKGQGNRKGKRLSVFETLSRWRNSMKLSYFLTGGASIAVLSLAILNSGQFHELVKPNSHEQETRLLTGNKTAKTAPGYTSRQLQRKESKTKGKNILRPSDALVQEEKESPAAIVPSKKQKQFSREYTAPAGKSVRRSVVVNKPTALVATTPEPQPAPGYQAQGRDKFEDGGINPTRQAAKDPVSTFSIDVDTASYSFIRQSLMHNVLPPKASIRIEEMINYFPYDYPGPDSRETPFKTNVTVLPTPWNKATRLIHIGIKGYNIKPAHKPHSNLVFLLDTSGSMNAPNKLPLLKNAFKLLLSTLSENDTVSIVAYAGSAGTVLPPTRVKDKAKILSSLERLQAGGSTAGGEGIRLAYQLAKANFDKAGVNRVILATDGDFNVGIRSTSDLKSFIERQRKSGVTLSVLGFGMGNYNDALMQTLAQNGNGNAAYIDSLSEARKVLVEEAASTLFTIAKDVKIQMEFNPKTVSEYRLIGYETRKLKREDFNNDKVDAGDIGSGHTVTAIYEITPVGAREKLYDPLRYKKPAADGQKTTENTANEYGFLKLRYKLPNQDKSRLIETPVKTQSALASFDDAPRDVRFAVSVAAFGQLLRGGKYLKDFDYDKVIAIAQKSKGDDPFGYRSEFVNLVRLAKSAAALQPQR